MNGEKRKKNAFKKTRRAATVSLLVTPGSKSKLTPTPTPLPNRGKRGLGVD